MPTLTENASPEKGIASGKLYLPALSEPKEIAEKERVLGVTITTRDRDREGDIVEPSGLDFANYLKNPVVLWAHDLTSAPVGRVVALDLRADRVDASVQFADTEAGRECFSLYRDRYLNAWSIGFIPRSWERLPSDGQEPGGFHILEAEVVELSAVPVPANPEALTRAVADGKLRLSARLAGSLALLESGQAAGEGETARSKKLKETEGPARLRKVRTAGHRLTPVGVVDTARKIALELMRREFVRAMALARGSLM